MNRLLYYTSLSIISIVNSSIKKTVPPLLCYFQQKLIYNSPLCKKMPLNLAMRTNLSVSTFSIVNPSITENFFPFLFITRISTVSNAERKKGKINWSLRSECRRRSKKPMLQLLREYWSTGNVSRNRQRWWVETLQGQWRQSRFVRCLWRIERDVYTRCWYVCIVSWCLNSCQRISTYANLLSVPIRHFRGTTAATS